MKIAVVGNSHAGCIKLAWDRIAADYPAVSMVFFAAGGTKMFDIHRQELELVPGNDALRQMMKHTSGGLETVDLTAYDALLFVSLMARPFFLPETSGYSEQVLSSSLQSLTEGKQYFRLVQEISGHFKGPVYIAHTPLRAARKKKREPQDTIAYFNGVARLNQAILAPLGATMCPQPAETIVNGQHTDEAYSIGARRLAVQEGQDGIHDDGDRKHMNADFGELWLRKFFTENFPQLSA